MQLGACLRLPCLLETLGSSGLCGFGTLTRLGQRHLGLLQLGPGRRASTISIPLRCLEPCLRVLLGLEQALLRGSGGVFGIPTGLRGVSLGLFRVELGLGEALVGVLFLGHGRRLGDIEMALGKRLRLACLSLCGREFLLCLVLGPLGIHKLGPCLRTRGCGIRLCAREGLLRLGMRARGLRQTLSCDGLRRVENTLGLDPLGVGAVECEA